jgi:HlyD family secretion protein
MVVLLAAIAAGVWWWLRPRGLEVRTAAATELTSAPGATGDRTVLNASGYVTARREATVSSKVTGKVVEVLVEEGVRVKQGEVLARLDSTNIQASLQLAQAQRASVEAAIEETRVRVKEADLELERQTSLKKNNVSSQVDFERAEASAHALRARLAQQQRDLVVSSRTIAIWEQQLEDMTIRAPFDGIVTSKNAQPGEMISPMSSGGFTRTGICTIVDMDSLEIEIDVNESYINRVAAGQPVEATLDAYPDWKIPCKVIAIIPTADRQKSTVRVRVGFNQLDPRILPEMSVKVGFREAAPSAAAAGPAVATREILIPKTALRSDGGRDIVYVAKDGKAERRAVSVSSTQGDQAVLRSGLAAGERVITEAPAELGDGSAIREKSL